MNHAKRKKEDHIVLALEGSNDLAVNPGFSSYRFEHNALPELDYATIDTSTKFLGKINKIPLIIASITGGGKHSEKINISLAEIANDFKIGFAVGSQRIAIDDPIYTSHFKMRTYAPDALLFANIGAVQLNYGYSVDKCKMALDMMDADALILHLNPLHEVFQVNGNTNFSCLLSKIEHLCRYLDAPVIVKEVGYGISSSLAKKLQGAGVYAVEIAGAGSISWTDIERRRSNDVVLHAAADAFGDWGNPTAECIRSIAADVKGMKIIGSGGVRTGVDIAKAIALGADFCANSRDFLRKITQSREECENFIESITMELRAAMFCTGCKSINDLKKAKLIKRTTPE
ncbi:MAG: type 2 isopentenyl-diphosphate Delta-isomerase [Holosporaceae bacterium]|nr:type 2 isopentenyl-diphosphate Delta-isomerase [Holosporaceae bacterium]